IRYFHVTGVQTCALPIFIANMAPVFLFNVTRAAMGAVQHFAVASATLSVSEPGAEHAASDWTVYPNPAKDYFEIKTAEPRSGERSDECVEYEECLVR